MNQALYAHMNNKRKRKKKETLKKKKVHLSWTPVAYTVILGI
jgi:hypothetical protein